MNDGGSIVEFFYNLIPGTLFLFSLKTLNIFDFSNVLPSKSDAFIIFSYIAVGLFLGFLLQGITIIFRHSLKWNYKQYREIQDKNSNFIKAYRKLNKGKIKDLSENEIKEMFYQMDCSLRTEKPSFLPTHFSSLFAFWANIFFASLLLLIIIEYTMLLVIIQGKWNQIGSLIIVTPIIGLMCALSYYFAIKFLRAFYDTVLNCYVMKI